jgi:hypothetical protein
LPPEVITVTVEALELNPKPHLLMRHRLSQLSGAFS